jgi:hypothetical protein
MKLKKKKEFLMTIFRKSLGIAKLYFYKYLAIIKIHAILKLSVYLIPNLIAKIIRQ